MTHIFRLILTILLAAAASSARADVHLIGVATIPGTASDLSGLEGKQTDGTPHNRLGGLGSAIAYSGHGNSYFLASDRGPVDGASDYRCRIHRMDIAVTPGAKPAVSLKLTATNLLSAENGTPLIGSTNATGTGPKAKAYRFDPEGIRVGPRGTVFISDEYGPYLSEFEESGKRLRSFPVPAKFIPKKHGKPDEELPPKNDRGRQPNRGLEGLAISPDGSKLFAMLQSPLIQDGALGKDNVRIGVNNRMLEVDVSSGSTREFIYALDAPTNGVNEILAIGEKSFLVLERDSLGGKEAKFKKVFRVDLADATDVSAVEELPSRALPAKVVAVRKKLFLDLLDPRFKIAGADVPEKFEGLAFGPDLPDGRRLLIVTADNDFVSTVPFRVYAFAVDRGDLPGFTQPIK